MEILLHNIDKNNFFYELITTMAYSQFGINELFSRGFLTQKLNEFPNQNDFLVEIKKFNFPPAVEQQIINFSGFTPVIVVPGFATKSGKKFYRMDPYYSAVRFLNDTSGITDVNIRITHLTVITAFEKIIDLTNHWSPVREFFRHIRNASAHNGKFHFSLDILNKQTGELKKNAEWETFKITSSNKEQKLFPLDKDDNDAFWRPGDFIDFLLDFENHHPEIKH